MTDTQPRYFVQKNILDEEWQVRHQQQQQAGKTATVLSPGCTEDEARTMAAALNARFYPETEVPDPRRAGDAVKPGYYARPMDDDSCYVLHRAPDGRDFVLVHITPYRPITPSPTCTKEIAETMVAALNARFYPEEPPDDELLEFAEHVHSRAEHLLLPSPFKASAKKTLTLLMATLRAAQEMP